MAIDKISGKAYADIDAVSGVATSGIKKISAVTAPSGIVTANLRNKYTPSNYSGTGALLDEIGSQNISISGATYSSTQPAHFDFDGVNDYGGSSTASWSPSDLSVGWWFNQDTISGIQVQASLYGGSYTQGLFPYTYSVVGARARWTNASNQFTETTYFSRSAFPLNQWVYIGVSRNNSTAKMNLYIGTSSGLTQYVTNFSTTSASTFTNSWVVYGSPDYPFNGSLGDYHIYNSVLSTAEWTQNFNAQKAYYGL
tara:strand:- start:355 stop:1116 length:762 start_codon:yes stop_codon:yes gene_type:complete